MRTPVSFFLWIIGCVHALYALAHICIRFFTGVVIFIFRKCLQTLLSPVRLFFFRSDLLSESPDFFPAKSLPVQPGSLSLVLFVRMFQHTIRLFTPSFPALAANISYVFYV